MALSKPAVICPRSVDALRPLKIIGIGAGPSGILSAIRLSQGIQQMDLVIYDKNAEIGGTWYENRYPGCSCDIPSHCYQLSFESNPEWSSFYAGAPEILKYWKRVVEKYGLKKYIKLSHKALEARWDEKRAKWMVRVEDLQSRKISVDEADVLLWNIGILNDYQWPDIQGLHDFQGNLIHSASWDTSFDCKEKNVAVIGNGASGVQIVPTIQPEVSHLDHYIRSPTWIATTVGANEVQARNDSGCNFAYTHDEIAGWKSDPSAYMAYRHRLEHALQSDHAISQRGSEIQRNSKAYFERLMRFRSQEKPEVGEALIPTFSPLCKRLTPGPGYLESLMEDNVEVMTTPIARIDANGIRTTDGIYRPIDAIICCTGFNTSFRNRLPIYGVNGLPLADKWHDHPTTYLSITTADFPNFFMSLGPNSGVGTGNMLIIIESIALYTAACIAKMQREHIRTMAPSTAAEASFAAFCDAYFVRTVYADDCRSWYKGGQERGRVTALWPGSSLHAVRALEHPRWEDFVYEYVDGNTAGWLGDGWSRADRNDGTDRAWYLRQGVVQEDLESSQLTSYAAQR